MQKELQSKNAEIDYLKAQLKKKEDENRALKEDKARILKEQMATLNKIQSQAAGGGPEGTFRIEQLDTVVHDAFNNDLTRRLDFMAKMIDWQRFGAVAQGAADADLYDPEVQDGELAGEHFTYRKSRLNLLMDKVYFPTIDAQEHLEMYRPSDFAIKLEHEKYHDMILVEMQDDKSADFYAGLVSVSGEFQAEAPTTAGDLKPVYQLKGTHFEQARTAY